MKIIEECLGDTASAVSEEPKLQIDIPEGLEILAKRFISSREKELSVFQELLATADLDAIRRLSHNLKGTGTSYGFPDISRLGASMERASKEGDQAEVAVQLSKLAEYVAAAMRHLETINPSL